MTPQTSVGVEMVWALNCSLGSHVDAIDALAGTTGMVGVIAIGSWKSEIGFAILSWWFNNPVLNNSFSNSQFWLLAVSHHWRVTVCCHTFWDSSGVLIVMEEATGFPVAMEVSYESRGAGPPFGSCIGRWKWTHHSQASAWTGRQRLSISLIAFSI